MSDWRDITKPSGSLVALKNEYGDKILGSHFNISPRFILITQSDDWWPFEEIDHAKLKAEELHL